MDNRVPRKPVIFCAAATALLVLADLLPYHHEGPHLPSLYIGISFLGCGALILLAVILGWLVNRQEDFYER